GAVAAAMLGDLRISGVGRPFEAARACPLPRDSESFEAGKRKRGVGGPRERDAFPDPKIFFFKTAFTTKRTPFCVDQHFFGTLLGQVLGRGAVTKISKGKVPPTRGSIAP